ncbi:Charged multivesicular body protein 7 [Echinococcus granulosus]|uniref:Charged multivesicular body protein 7 n=2 Tax=Echinococcus granulosus TaxID=6210 RepID=W6U7F4_ECHGR|nr:Charged multivesicular body protein 7 [Echinococcus granulosus]EUB56291.1 Charged multivesicular body protein 7 [Echinococcus granulosus]
MEKFKLPEVWGDDDEIYSLFVPIKRPRHLDPVLYDHKVSFWRDLIVSYAKHNRIAVVTEASLTKLFKREFRSDGVTYYPLCLHQVLNDMMNNGLLNVVKQDGMFSSIMSWGLEWVIRKPASWVWAFIQGADSLNDDLNQRSYESPDTPLYLTEHVAPLCKQFIENLKSSQESLIHGAHVYMYDDFDDALVSFFEHTPTRLFISNQLSERGFIKVESSTPVELVFLLTEKQPINLDSKTLASIAHLRKTMRQISQDENRLSSEIAARRARVRELARNNQKQVALDMLRRCKQLEADLARKTQHLTQLEALELKISAAKDNRTVLHAISDASLALKQTTGGLEGLEDAEKTMDEIVEAMDDVNSISNAILTSPDSFLGAIKDEKELTVELEDLLSEKTLPKKVEQDASERRLPSLPKDEVGESDEEEKLLHGLGSLDLKDASASRARSNPDAHAAQRERVSAGSNGCDTQARAIDGASHRHKRYVDWPPT